MKTLQDQFIQTWHYQLEISTKALNYKLFKNVFCFEEYLSILPYSASLQLCKLRTSNHKLPIETGRYTNTPRGERTCTLCHQNLGDEFHFILECDSLNYLRNKHIAIHFNTTRNIFSFITIMQSKDYQQLSSLVAYITAGLKRFQ